MLTWHCKPFNELTLHQLYDLLKIRTDVFVVEQNCPYPELDNIDKHSGTKHLFAMDKEQPVAYARIIAPDISYALHSSIGRVLVIEKYRKNKIGHELIDRAIQVALYEWPTAQIKIGAQSRLENVYQSHGFVTASPPYMEDGIEHISMLLTPSDQG
jgi:ElaA protein